MATKQHQQNFHGDRRVPRPAVLNLAVRQREAGAAGTIIFAYSGTVDAEVMHGVFGQAERLCAALPGRWCIELVTTLAPTAIPWPLLRRLCGPDARMFRRRRRAHRRLFAADRPLVQPGFLLVDSTAPPRQARLLM